MTENPVLDALLGRFSGLTPPPKDGANVSRVVQRLPGERRCTPDRVILDTEEGVVGDRWALGKRKRVSQVTLMRADVAAMLCPDDGYEIFGDNLFATIDTSAANLPPGTIVRVGTARCRVTPEPHMGCSKFARRAVPQGRALLDLPQHLPLQLRGVHLEILESGSVAPGEPIVVESRS